MDPPSNFHLLPKFLYILHCYHIFTSSNVHIYKIIAPFLDHFTFQNYILGGFCSVWVVSVHRANHSEAAAQKPSAYVWKRCHILLTMHSFPRTPPPPLNVLLEINNVLGESTDNYVHHMFMFSFTSLKDTHWGIVPVKYANDVKEV